MPTIIMVEDKDTHREMLEMTLSSLGYETIPCSTVAEVQRQVSGLAAPPSGILLDLQIPPDTGAAPRLEHGRDCGLWLRNQTQTRDVPIVAYSAFTDDERIPGWCDIIGTAAILRKHKDSIKDFERVIKENFR